MPETMRQSTTVQSLSVRATVGPARAAYLVRAGDRGAFVRAIQAASSRWGGVTEPIVPVRKSGNIDGRWIHTVELSGVDGLLNVNVPDELAAAAQQQVDLPVFDLEKPSRGDRIRYTVHPVNVGDQRSPPDGGQYLMAHRDSFLWQRVAAGDYSPDLESDLAQFPVERAKDRIQIVERFVNAQINGFTWLDVGTRQLEEITDIESHYESYWEADTSLFDPGLINEQWYRGGIHTPPLILWITRRDSLQECLWFWNLRAVRSSRYRHIPMLLVPLVSELSWEQLGMAIRPFLQRAEDVVPDVAIGSLNIDVEILTDIGHKLGLTPTTEIAKSTWTPRPGPLRNPPYTFQCNESVGWQLAYRRRYGSRTDVTTPVMDGRCRIEFDSPIVARGSGGLLVRMATEKLVGLPQRQSVATMFNESAVWRTGDLQLPAPDVRRLRFDLQLPSDEDIAWTVLRDHCQDAQISDKGKLAQALQDIGGIDFLLDEAVRDTIQDLTTGRSKSLMRELQQQDHAGKSPEWLKDLAVRWGGTRQRRFRPASQLPLPHEPNSLKAAELLCSRGWAERGLSLMCGKCGVLSFVPLSASQAQPLCPACDTPQAFESVSAHGAPEICYRLHGLADRASDQGVVAQLLAVAVLHTRDIRTCLIPGAEIILSDGKPAEVDLYGMFDGMIIAGEAKNKAREFEHHDLKRDFHVSSALGADTHIMVAYDQLSDDVIARSHKLADTYSVGLIIVEGSELSLIAEPPKWQLVD